MLDLQKGIALNLTKADWSALHSIRVGMSWDVQEWVTADLDLFIVQKLADKSKKVAFFNAKNAIKWVTLWDDNLTGEGDGDDEFALLDARQTEDWELFVCVNIYTSGVKFSQVKNAKVTVYNQETGEAIASYVMGDGWDHTALVVGKIVDAGDTYSFTAMWDYIDGNISTVTESL